MAPTATSAAFAKEEKVFCFHHELLYEAKVLDVKRQDEKDKNSPFLYMVHYKGWKNSWDDWVPQDRLRKLTDEYRELAANLKKDIINPEPRRQPVKGTGSKKGTNMDPSSQAHSPQPGGGRKGRKDNEIESEDTFLARPSVKLYVPENIKGYLVDDWEYITKNYQLVPLPSASPVNWIMDTYFTEEKINRRLGSPEAALLEEIHVGLKEWFRRTLGKTLLYKFERAQYSDICQLWENVSDKSDPWFGRGVGDCYGVEHLCRLLVKMPEYVAQTNMDAQSVSTLRHEMDIFMVWLGKNVGRFVCKAYEPATPEYIERATGTVGGR